MSEQADDDAGSLGHLSGDSFIFNEPITIEYPNGDTVEIREINFSRAMFTGGADGEPPPTISEIIQALTNPVDGETIKAMPAFTDDELPPAQTPN